MKRFKIPVDALDAIGLAGASALVFGAAQIYRPAGWIVAGVLLLAYFVLGAFAERRKELTK